MTVKTDPILNKLFLFLLFIAANSIQAQIFDHIYLEGDAVTKFSVGKETRDHIEYRNNINVDVPENSKFDSPVFGLNFSLNYQINKSFIMGIGSGINVVHKDKHPIISNEYYDKIMLPLFTKFRYHHQFAENWLFSTDLNAGYQVSQFLYGYSNGEYDFEEKGGLLANLDFGIGKNLGKYTPVLKLGYEINQFRRKDSLGWIDESLQYDDKVVYKIYYHLIKLSLSIQI
ncbi:hypothetical protein [Gramella sp. AN32]|uniref:Outer membrane protein beta-barrel domain-containing protein n=1 Tax=Christiangramia antarctica TaxID=2058158 RepID=A0ABW5X6Z8_9FLAO|nr:hypothetical protein [Gramella sp. AN32]MCM4155974.1 hypothetical protein [Gramella sp. AN32]